MSQISKKVRDSLKTVLSDATTGFNANLAAIESAYGITAFTVDWGATSDNFFQSNVSPESLEEANVVEHQTTVFLYSVASSNLSRTKPSQFSGDVTVNLDFWIRHAGAEIPNDSESLADAIEDAAITAMQHPTAPWPDPVTQGGLIRFDRGPLLIGAENWRQLVRVVLTVQLDTE